MTSFDADWDQRSVTTATTPWDNQNVTYRMWASPQLLSLVTLVAALIVLCGVVGNGIVIWFLGFRLKRNPFSVYILNLAVGDVIYLLAGLLYAPQNVAIPSLQVFIRILSSTQTSLNLLRQSLLVAVGTEHCVSVIWAFWYRRHRPTHLSTTVCALLWGHSLGLVWLFVLCFCDSVYSVIDWFLQATFLGLCVISLTLFLRVQCGSSREQGVTFCGTAQLTVLVSVLLNLPLLAIYATYKYIGAISFSSYQDLNSLCIPLTFLTKGANPVLFYFVGCRGQQGGRKSLQAVLQRAMTDGDEAAEQRGGSPVASAESPTLTLRTSRHSGNPELEIPSPGPRGGGI